MTTLLKNKLFIIFLLTLCFSKLVAQEMNFTDAQNMKVWYNQSLKTTQSREAKVAIRNVVYEGILSLNSQAIMLNMPFLNKGKRDAGDNNKYFSFSVGAASESNGNAFKKSLGLIGVSYAVQLTGDKMYVAGGFQGLLTQTKYNLAGASFPDQFNDFGPIANTPSIDPLQVGKTFQMLSLNAGVSLFKNAEHLNWYIGASIQHANKPFSEETKSKEYQLAPTIGTQGGVKFIQQKQEFDAYSILRFNRFENDILVGCSYNIYFGRSKNNQDNNLIGVGCGYRLNDAIIPHINLQYEGTQLAFHYDINSYSVSKSIFSRTGFELAISKKF